MSEPNTTSEFINPYAGCEKDGSGVRLQTFIPSEDYRFVQRLRGGMHGTMTTTVNLLFSKLVAALRAKGMSDFTNQDEFEEFVSKLELHEPGKSKLIRSRSQKAT